MGNHYIQFSIPSNQAIKTPDQIKPLAPLPDTTSVPIANPAFQQLIPLVATWLIEFEGDSYFPEREIGLDAQGNCIVAMPWQNNYGYWTDQDLQLRHFSQHFEVTAFTGKAFNAHWKQFELQQASML